MRKIVISEFMNEQALDPLRGEYDVVYDQTLVDDRRRLLAELADAVALIVRNRTQVDDELLAAAPRLRAVGRLGVGLDNIDADACARRTVSVHPATGANAQAVAEYATAALLILFRGAYRASERMVNGEWPRGSLQGSEVAGKRLGLVGFGGVARMVAARASALGMQVAACDPYLDAGDAAWAEAERVESVAVLLASSDAVSLHVPLDRSTRHLIDRASLAQMQHGAILINTSRGGIVDDRALAEALREGRIGGAALDVFETEPLDASAGAMFAGIDNLILTPHIAGLTAESNDRVSEATVRNVREALAALA